MGFRDVEPDASEPQPVFPLRSVIAGSVVLAVLPLLPVVAALVVSFVSVLEVRRSDSPGAVQEAREFSHQELEPIRRVYPDYPQAAKDLGLPAQRCLAVVSIDPQGVPHRVDVRECPEVFGPPTRDAMLQWRWVPPTHEGRPVSARTTIAVTYKMEPPDRPVQEWTELRREEQRDEARVRLEQRRVERIVEAEEPTSLP